MLCSHKNPLFFACGKKAEKIPFFIHHQEARVIGMALRWHVVSKSRGGAGKGCSTKRSVHIFCPPSRNDHCLEQTECEQEKGPPFAIKEKDETVVIKCETVKKIGRDFFFWLEEVTFFNWELPSNLLHEVAIHSVVGFGAISPNRAFR
ncbi:hypothetical protein NPIL_139531 [Nephila pilipes]|uniref:Uncharacterized protein n=1 Tax=Nephila pilipes TaxID=299642 RepID=A0A8X6MLZ4_NEPPI|nr:hypothetical protein NPIL_139531 [Nephila pilipes]